VTAASRIGSKAAPRVPEEIEAVSVGADDPLEEFSDVAISGAQLAGSSAQALQFVRSRLTKVNFSESLLPRLDATDVVFADCNLSNVEVESGSFHRVVFAQCKLSGIQLTKGTFDNVAFEGCRLELASFYQVKLKHVSFRDCQIEDGDFAETTLDHVEFQDCNLTQATFARMRIERSEMRRCTLTRLNGLEQLRGIAMELDDIVGHADQFAAALGIRIAAPRR
jgi:uncharacterized protein YjbI with pentapeptide repeats